MWQFNIMFVCILIICCFCKSKLAKSSHLGYNPNIVSLLTMRTKILNRYNVHELLLVNTACHKQRATCMWLKGNVKIVCKYYFKICIYIYVFKMVKKENQMLLKINVKIVCKVKKKYRFVITLIYKSAKL